MRRKKKTKKECQMAHFQKRCIQRIGRLLDRKEIIRQIQNNELEFIRRDSNRVSIFKYVVDNIPYKVVYDKLRKQVVTIYELDEKNSSS